MDTLTTKPVKISVITAVYNNVDHIEGCIESLLAQTFSNIEHIVVDGGSTDGTLEILQKHVSRFAVLISEPDRGICDAWNKGLSAASGDVIGFLHSDDYFSHDHVLERIALRFENPDVDAVYSDLDYVSQVDSMTVVRSWRSKPFNPRSIGFGWMPAHPTLFVRQGFYKPNGYFNLGFAISGDYLSILQMFMRPGFNAAYLPEVTIKMRLGGVSNAYKNLLRKSLEDFKALRLVGYSTTRSAFVVFFKMAQKIGQFLN